MPSQLQVQTYASYSRRKTQQPLHVASLQDTLLERVTGANPLPADGAYIRLGAQKTVPKSNLWTASTAGSYCHCWTVLAKALLTTSTSDSARFFARWQPGCRGCEVRRCVMKFKSSVPGIG